MARVRYHHPKTGEDVWGPYPGHGVWNTPHGIHRLHQDYNKDPKYVDAWRQVRQDSLDAVLGKTTGIHASPIRIPANAPHRPPGGHRGEIGDPSDRSNYLDEAYEFQAVEQYLNRTGWYSDENRMKRMMDKMQMEAAAKEPTPAPQPEPPPQLDPQPIDTSGAEAPVGGIGGPSETGGGTGGGGYQGGPAYTSVWGDPPAPRLKHVRAAGGGRLDTRSTIYGSRGMFNREGLRIQNLNV